MGTYNIKRFFQENCFLSSFNFINTTITAVSAVTRVFFTLTKWIFVVVTYLLLTTYALRL